MINIILRLLGRMLFDCSDGIQFQQQGLMHANAISELRTGVPDLPEVRQELWIGFTIVEQRMLLGTEALPLLVP